MSSSNEFIAKTTSFFRTKEKLEGWVVVFFLVFSRVCKNCECGASGFPRLTAAHEGARGCLDEPPKRNKQKPQYKKRFVNLELYEVKAPRRKANAEPNPPRDEKDSLKLSRTSALKSGGVREGVF